jgi:hypothetical protein
MTLPLIHAALGLAFVLVVALAGDIMVHQRSP